jgi:hypothetical protein
MYFGTRIVGVAVAVLIKVGLVDSLLVRISLMSLRLEQLGYLTTLFLISLSFRLLFVQSSASICLFLVPSYLRLSPVVVHSH